MASHALATILSFDFLSSGWQFIMEPEKAYY